MSFDRGVPQEEVVHIHNGILLSHSSERNTSIFSNMDGPRNYHAKEGSQTTKHQHQMLSLTCGIWKKDRMNFFAEQIVTYRIWKTYGFQRRQFWGLGDVLRLWDGNHVKLHCDDHLTTINVINSLSKKKKEKAIPRSLLLLNNEAIPSKRNLSYLKVTHAMPHNLTSLVLLLQYFVALFTLLVAQ